MREFYISRKAVRVGELLGCKTLDKLEGNTWVLESCCSPKYCYQIDWPTLQSEWNRPSWEVCGISGWYAFFDINPWYGKGADEERVKTILRQVSSCWNLQKFETYGLMRAAQAFDLKLNMAINRGWRRDLCYTKFSPPPKLLPFVRAIRKTQQDLRADMVLPLLRERMSDMISAHNK